MGSQLQSLSLKAGEILVIQMICLLLCLVSLASPHIFYGQHFRPSGMAGWATGGENQGTVAMVNPKQVMSGFKDKKWLLEHLAEGNIYSRHKESLGSEFIGKRADQD